MRGFLAGEITHADAAETCEQRRRHEIDDVPRSQGEGESDGESEGEEAIERFVDRIFEEKEQQCTLEVLAKRWRAAARSRQSEICINRKARNVI